MAAPLRCLTPDIEWGPVVSTPSVASAMLEERVRIRSSFGILRDLTNQFDKFDALTIASPFGLGKQIAAPAPATTPDLGDSIQPKKRGKGASGEAFAKDAVATEENER